MESSRRRLLGAIAASTTLAGCLSGGSGTDTTTATATDADTGMDDGMGTETGSPMGTATVQVRDHQEHGGILVDGEGMTLYMFDNDTKGSGESTCSGGCAESWPPLTVEGEATAGDAVTASLSTFERSNGDVQVAAAGWPLYYFASDGKPGDAKGQGVGGVWWVLGPDGTPMRASTPTETEGGY